MTSPVRQTYLLVETRDGQTAPRDEFVAVDDGLIAMRTVYERISVEPAFDGERKSISFRAADGTRATFILSDEEAAHLARLLMEPA